MANLGYELTNTIETLNGDDISDASSHIGMIQGLVLTLKPFRYLNDQKDSFKEVREHIHFLGHYRTYDKIFVLLTVAGDGLKGSTRP